MEVRNQQILNCLQQGQSFAVATIMSQSGSTPGTSGSKMIVKQDRTVCGTIGGGVVEARVIDACLDLIDRNKCMILEFTLDCELKDGLDMVCGGNLTVLVEPHKPNMALIVVYQNLVGIEKKGKKGFLVSEINGFSSTEFTTRKLLVLPDGTLSETHLLPKLLVDTIHANEFSGTSPVIYRHALTEFIIEPVYAPDIIYIFGAGHVGFYLAGMAHLANFQTIVIDDREEFANRKRFPYAGNIFLVDHFGSAFDTLFIDDSSYIVIVTRGHLHDQVVLEAALKTNAAYIGMIGSRSKREKTYSNLEKKGMSRQILDTVYSPIGLDIHAETPAEIGVSIIGQIIQVRAEK